MTIEDLKRAVLELPEEELAEFSDWLIERREEAWDERLEQDVTAGKLDALAGQARAQHRAGKTRPL